MADHTEGPWVQHVLAVSKGGDLDRYMIAHLGISSSHIPSEESEANARLIAAAPDLLDACEESVAGLYDSIYGGDEQYSRLDVKYARRLILNLEAAVRKAKDGQRAPESKTHPIVWHEETDENDNTVWVGASFYEDPTFYWRLRQRFHSDAVEWYQDHDEELRVEEDDKVSFVTIEQAKAAVQKRHDETIAIDEKEFMEDV